MLTVKVVYRSNDLAAERYLMHNEAELLTSDGMFKIPSENGWVFIPVDMVHKLELGEL